MFRLTMADISAEQHIRKQVNIREDVVRLPPGFETHQLHVGMAAQLSASHLLTPKTRPPKDSVKGGLPRASHFSVHAGTAGRSSVRPQEANMCHRPTIRPGCNPGIVIAHKHPPARREATAAAPVRTVKFLAAVETCGTAD